MSTVANDLQAGFEILWYRIESVLGRGGFGITYLARDTNLGQLVAIKEYLPQEFAARGEDSTVRPVSVAQEDVYSWGLERFMSEAQTLAKFRHPNIVRVLSVFKHNNTGYMVMEYEEGEDLSVIYKREKRLPQAELERIYFPIIDGLALVHEEGFIHRDIKPANIVIRTDGSPVLIDFGAARQAIGSKTQTLTSMLSIGYAPFEQYNDEPGKQGPWTDIYALGASIYQGITGEKPIESTARGMALLEEETDPFEPLSIHGFEGYSHDFLRAIDQALMLQAHDRPQSLENFLGMLCGEIILPELTGPEEKVPEATVRLDKTVVSPPIKQSGESRAEVIDSEVSDTILVPPLRKASPESSTSAEEESVTARIAPAPEKGRSPRSLLLAGGVVAVAVVVAIVVLSPREPSPEEVAKQQVNDLLAMAEELFDSGEYRNDAGSGALGTWREVLPIDPGNAEALEGIGKIAQIYLEQALEEVDAGRSDEAEASLDIVAGIDPDYPGLQDAKVRLSESRDTAEKVRQIERLLGEAETAMSEGRLYAPEKDNAMIYYREVRKLDPENVEASLGLSEVADTLIGQAWTALDEKSLEKAVSLANLVAAIDPDRPALEDLRRQIATDREIEGLLAMADAAFARQRYTLPEDDNAYDLYRQVLELEPSNQLAGQRLGEIAEYYAGRVSSLTLAGRLSVATTNLDTLARHFPDFAAISSLRQAIEAEKAEQARLAQQRRQRDLDLARAEQAKLAAAKALLPEGIDQQQDDAQVVRDIVEKFIQSFERQDMEGLRKVSQLGNRQQHYQNIFNSYSSLNLSVAPDGFSLNTREGIARVAFEITDLVDAGGNLVITNAGWAKFDIQIKKQDNAWLKVEIM